MNNKKYFRLTYKGTAKDSCFFNNYLYCELQNAKNLSGDVVLELIGLSDYYTAEEITREEYLNNI